jgi:hypothetical protein
MNLADFIKMLKTVLDNYGDSVELYGPNGQIIVGYLYDSTDNSVQLKDE